MDEGLRGESLSYKKMGLSWEDVGGKCGMA